MAQYTLATQSRLVSIMLKEFTKNSQYTQLQILRAIFKKHPQYGSAIENTLSEEQILYVLKNLKHREIHSQILPIQVITQKSYNRIYHERI
jgi:cellobiose-specific phosphotransferase system component IIB